MHTDFNLNFQVKLILFYYVSECSLILGLDSSVQQNLVTALDQSKEGLVMYDRFLAFLSAHLGKWHLAEPDIARKVIRAMGSPHNRR